ncbi:hypothetical protein ACFPRL_25500 [Pseudoclavibacter helvolus]
MKASASSSCFLHWAASTGCSSEECSRKSREREASSPSVTRTTRCSNPTSSHS